MYAMSWELDTRDYKYESIQNGYEVEYYEENENGEDFEISIETITEEEFDEEFAM